MKIPPERLQALNENIGQLSDLECRFAFAYIHGALSVGYELVVNYDGEMLLTILERATQRQIEDRQRAQAKEAA